MCLGIPGRIVSIADAARRLLDDPHMALDGFIGPGLMCGICGCAEGHASFR